MIAGFFLLAALPLASGDSPCDQWLRGYYGKIPYAEYSVIDRAARCLEGNAGGTRQNAGWPWFPSRAARPSTESFFGVWNWDCAFMSLAMSKWDVALARAQFEVFADLQREDGMYPDCWKWVEGGTAKEGVFAGASKPPVLAWAVWTAEQAQHDPKFLARAYDSLKRNVAWWKRRRLGPDGVLFHYDGETEDPVTRRKYAGWESGMDNSPRWDGNAWRLYPVDLNCYMIMTFRALKAFAATVAPSDVQIWADAEARLVERVNERLWDAESGCYYDWNFEEEKYSRVLTPVAFLPLYVGIATDAQAKSMARLAERLSPGWPTVAYDEPSYDPTGYWRGRTWINLAYMALRGLKWYGYGELAETGKASVMGWMLRDPACFYENYDSATGRPVGCMFFGWSNAFAVKFVLDWDNERKEEMPL